MYTIMACNRSRGWAFTINNWTRDDIDNVCALTYRYIVVGFELGESETPHMQGYVLFKSQRTFSSVCRSFGGRAHVEAAIASPEKNREYCTKDGEWIEDGDRPKQGARGDLGKARELAKTEGMRAVSQVCNLQQIKVAEVFLKYNEPERDWPVEVIWIIGPSGSGKSRLATELTGEDDVYRKDSTKWWEGYDGHAAVIWDDIRGDTVRIDELLRICDRYGHRIECKGSSRQLLARKIVFTSIQHPHALFPWSAAEPFAQLERRLSRVIEM